MASHYVCTGGCLTVQYSPGKCRIKTCARFRNPLTECRCRNGKHGDLLYKNHPDRDNILKSLKTTTKKAK
jgi:hypothetical protein